MSNYLNETAERLAIVLASENTNAAILDVLKDIIIDMENGSQISSYHPEVIKIVYPLMVERLGEVGEGYHDSIRCIIENENAIDQTLFDGMGAPFTTQEAYEKIKVERSFTEKLVSFLNDVDSPEDYRQSLIDFIGYEFNEADVSILADSVLPSALIEFAETVKPEWLNSFKQTALNIINSKEIWKFEKVNNNYRFQVSNGEPLDLSEMPATEENSCIDLARHISAILKDGRTPKDLYNAISEYLGERNTDVLTDFVDSPEYIATQLC